MNVIALIPAFNEALGIATIVTGAGAHLPVLVVEDGSSDDTAARASDAGTEVLRLALNQGEGAALRAGFRRTLDACHDAVVTLDADGQHDPEEIPKLLSAYSSSHADLIIGARDFGQMPPVRRLANSLGGWAFSWALGRPVSDNQSGSADKPPAHGSDARQQ